MAFLTFYEYIVYLLPHPSHKILPIFRQQWTDTKKSPALLRAKATAIQHKIVFTHFYQRRLSFVNMP